MASPFLTPPDSLDDATLGSDNKVLVSMSTTFYPREDHPSDLIIISSDNVFFSVHKRVLLERSQNAFGGQLYRKEYQSFTVNESSEVFNLILHVFYDFDPVNYKPTLDQIACMLSSLPIYGLAPSTVIIPGKPMYNHILSMALHAPLDTYALVCQHRLEVLAIEISHHLISVPLHSLTDEQCLSMGPIYLRRLVFLHLGRTERLKQLLKDPPVSHAPTQHCDAIDQKRKLHAAWKEAAGQLCFEASANTPVSLLHASLTSVIDRLSCEECKTATRERIRKLIVDWTLVKTTI
jgi:hypothetical protein